MNAVIFSSVEVSKCLNEIGYNAVPSKLVVLGNMPCDEPLDIHSQEKCLGTLHFSDRTNSGANENHWVFEIDDKNKTCQDEDLVLTFVKLLYSTFYTKVTTV